MRYSVIVTLLILACACFAADAPGPKNVYKAVIDTDGVQKADVLAGAYFFNPDYIIVKVNVPVEFKVRKEPGIVPHDFVLKAPRQASICLNP